MVHGVNQAYKVVNNPTEGTTTFSDDIYGDITVDNSELDDMILIKSDGYPTYNFANVIDDHLMGITHVVRGSEYLSSAPKYNLLYEAFGWEIPIAANLPAIAIVLILTIILIKGVKESTKVATIMVGVNMFIILSFVVVGAFYVRPENWVPFAPNGLEGIFSGAFIIFFAYIGFDAISTAAEETKNPQKDLPIGLIGSLLACSIIYILVTIVLDFVLGYTDLFLMTDLQTRKGASS